MENEHEKALKTIKHYQDDKFEIKTTGRLANFLPFDDRKWAVEDVKNTVD